MTCNDSQRYQTRLQLSHVSAHIQFTFHRLEALPCESNAVHLVEWGAADGALLLNGLLCGQPDNHPSNIKGSFFAKLLLELASPKPQLCGIFYLTGVLRFGNIWRLDTQILRCYISLLSSHLRESLVAFFLSHPSASQHLHSTLSLLAIALFVLPHHKPLSYIQVILQIHNATFNQQQHDSFPRNTNSAAD